jgi:hypothetical protein
MHRYVQEATAAGLYAGSVSRKLERAADTERAALAALHAVGRTAAWEAALEGAKAAVYAPPVSGVFVYDYNGVAGDNFQVFWKEQAANYVVPITITDEDGNNKVIGAPEAGLTNQQCWAQYGIAIAGAVAPATAKARDGIDGLVNPI